MTRDAERWRTLDSLLERALDLPPGEREAFLATATDDDGLRAEVFALLAIEGGVGDFLETGGLEIPPEVVAEVTTGLNVGFAEGTVVGRYRILSELGRGGMSRVYLAERADGQFEQTVALKVLRSDLRTEELAERIRGERQILASLDHPGIARVFDGGVTDDGRPYLVIEVVHGERLDRYADRQALPVIERIALFQKMCAAVGYAHQNLVVHRDLKPSNVLVSENGDVKLLDFGIAKLLDAPADREVTEGPHTRWMTPGYAAPEQILGKPVTTATDVYALGVVLYELLCGHQPFGADSRSAFVLEKAILEELPARPSTASGRSRERRTGFGTETITPAELARARSSEPDRLRRTLDGDLDAIVIKALRKEPGARYSSVGAMADDLQRYLDGFPVEAHEGAGVYRAKKFVQRNRVPVAAAAVLAAVLTGGAGVLSVQQAQTVRERDRANDAAALAAAEAENAQLVTDFLADVFRGRDPNQAPGDTVSAGELLDWGLERVESEFADRPAVQAELLSVLAGAQWNLGFPDESVALHERAVEVSRAAFGDQDVRTADALVGLAEALGRTRDFEAGLAAWREILQIRRLSLPPDHPDVAGALIGLAADLRDVGRPDTAEVLLREGLEIRRAVLGEDSEEYAAGLINLAYVLRAQQKLGEAEAIYREAIPKYRAVKGDRDAALPIYLNNLAFLLRSKEDYEGAAELYEEALTLATNLYGRGHPNALLVGNNLASSLHELDRMVEVESVLRANFEAASEQWPDGHARVARSWQALGLAILRAGDPGRAEAELQGAVGLNEALGDRGLVDVTTTSGGALAAAMILTGRSDEGEELMARVYQRVEYLAGQNDGRVPFTRVGGLAALILTLEETGLTDHAARFEALFPDGWRG